MIREMIVDALDQLGGVEYLMETARSHPTAFLSLVGKVLPMTVQGPGADGAHVFTVIERRVVRPGN